MQGIFIREDTGWTRPESKKQVREFAAAAPSRIAIEATSLFGNEYEGPATEAPMGEPIFFAGPDPHTKRRFYGVLTVDAGGKVTVK